MPRVTTRPRGFIVDYSPAPHVESLINTVSGILNQYRSYGPMTVRQIFYRLVATIGYDKTEQAYGRLCETLVKARRAKLIDFADIRDDGGTRLEHTGYDSLRDCIERIEWTIKNFRLKPSLRQPTRLLVMTEASGMAPMVAVTARDRYGLPVLSDGGFNGLAGKYQLAEDIAQVWNDEARPTVVLHIGDYDPSGEHIPVALSEDLQAFVFDMTGGETDALRVDRIAVTEHQILSLGLATAPAKATDRRSFAGVGGDGTSTVQAEAIDPATLAQIVEAAILRYWDAGVASLVQDEQREGRRALARRWGSD